MVYTLLSQLEKDASLTDEEKEIIKASFREMTFAKKDLLLLPGKVSKYEYFIAKGCIRAYIVDQKGHEHNIRFGIENSWIGDLYSFFKQTESTCHIQAIEASTVLAIDYENFNHLMNTMPKFEHFSRLLFQYGVMANQLRLSQSLALTAEERYLSFIEKYPHLQQRIPQKHIASYLGMTAEFLSLLRKKITQK